MTYKQTKEGAYVFPLSTIRLEIDLVLRVHIFTLHLMEHNRIAFMVTVQKRDAFMNKQQKVSFKWMFI